MAKKKRHYSIDGKPADKVEELRKFYGIDTRDLGVGVNADKELQDKLKNPYKSRDLELETQKMTYKANEVKKASAKGKRFVESQIEHYGSNTEVNFNKWLLNAREVYGDIGDENFDVSSFIKENYNMIKKEIGTPGHKVKAGKRTRTETGYLVSGGSGLLGRINRIETSYPSLKAEFKNNSEWKRGGLTIQEYNYLSSFVGKKRLKENDFLGIIKQFNVVKGNKPSKFTQNTKAGYLFMKFMNYRLGKVQIKERTTIEDVEVEAKVERIPEDKIVYFKQLKKDEDILTSIGETDLKNYLRDIHANDEDLKQYSVVLEGNAPIKVKDILKTLYNNSEAHLQQGGLPEELKNASVSEVMNWIKESYNPVEMTMEKIKQLKGILPNSTYKLIMTSFVEGRMDKKTIEYIERLTRGWVGIRLPSQEDGLLSGIVKAYRSRTPKNLIRTESWFKAANIEFTGSKYKDVLFELADRIAQNDYSDLFDFTTEIKQWYQNWGNSDERVVELIENLERNTGLEADWGLADETLDEKHNREISKKDIDKWAGRYAEYFKGKGFTKEEIDEIFKKDFGIL